MQFLETKGAVVLAGLLGAVIAAGCGGDGADGEGAGGAGGGGPTNVTFHKDVEPILQKSCLGCHYEGKIGGFSLLTYEQASSMAGSIARVTADRSMPPWGARTTDECQPRFPFRNDIRLTDDEIAILSAWDEAGAPEGDPADAPPAFQPSADGLPGAELELVPNEPSVVSGDSDQFTCVIYDPAVTEEKWIDGIHLIPDNTKVAHHALTFRVNRDDALAMSGGTERFPCFGGAPGAIVHVWAPGGNPFELPADVGVKLKPEEVLVVQMHYHPSGAAEELDASTIQLRFKDQKPQHQFVVTFPGNAESAADGLLPGPNDQGEPEFRIPANVSDHTETMEVRVPDEIFLELPILMVMTHMHYVGTDIRLEIERPTERANQPQKECLVHTPEWDFNWQRMYTYDVPIDQLPTGKAGDLLRITCHYDNSMENPFVQQALEDEGLSAPHDVLLGEETLDEMCLAPLGILVPASIDL